MKDFDTRDALALLIIGGFVVGAYVTGGTAAGIIKDLAFLAAGFYFGNKATLDKPGE